MISQAMVSGKQVSNSKFLAKIVIAYGLKL